MIHGNPVPRNLSDLVEAGGMDDAVDLRDRGYSGQKLRDQLARRYPNAYSQSIRALADRSIAVRQAGRRLAAAQSTEEAASIDVPLIEGAPAGLTASFGVQYNPGRGGEPIMLHAWVRNADTLTVGELEALGAELLERAEFTGETRYERLVQWIEAARLRASQGDEEAAAELRRFRDRLTMGEIKLTAAMRGR